MRSHMDNTDAGACVNIKSSAHSSPTVERRHKARSKQLRREVLLLSGSASCQRLSQYTTIRRANGKQHLYDNLQIDSGEQRGTKGQGRVHGGVTGKKKKTLTPR